jgi:hypothetical protein
MPLANRTTPANGSEREQVIPLQGQYQSQTSEFGRPRKIWVDQLKFQCHVFNKSVVSHGFNENTADSLSDGKELQPVSMLFFA